MRSSIGAPALISDADPGPPDSDGTSRCGPDVAALRFAPEQRSRSDTGTPRAELTVARLRQVAEFGATERPVRRDIDALEAAGFPLDVTKRAGASELGRVVRARVLPPLRNRPDVGALITPEIHDHARHQERLDVRDTLAAQARLLRTADHSGASITSGNSCVGHLDGLIVTDLSRLHNLGQAFHREPREVRTKEMARRPIAVHACVRRNRRGYRGRTRLLFRTRSRAEFLSDTWGERVGASNGSERGAIRGTQSDGLADTRIRQPVGEHDVIAILRIAWHLALQFPHVDYDSFRHSSLPNTIDFEGRSIGGISAYLVLHYAATKDQLGGGLHDVGTREDDAIPSGS